MKEFKEENAQDSSIKSLSQRDRHKRYACLRCNAGLLNRELANAVDQSRSMFAQHSL